MKERGNPVLRWLDRFVGIPLIFILGCLKKKKELKEQDRIGILLMGGIGDTVLLTALLQDLQGKTITLFTSKSNAEMARLIPGIEVIPLSVFLPYCSTRKIRKTSFDVFIDANPWPRINALFSFFAKAQFKIGFKTKREHRHYVYDHVVEHSTECHELDNLRSLLKVLNIETKHNPHVPIDDEIKSSDKIALHLYAGGSRAYLKEWSEKNWIDLIDSLIKKGFSLILTGSPSDQERLNKVRSKCTSQEKIDIAAGKLSLHETARLLKTVHATISIDTGIMHLAAAVGCPLICLHGPTPPKRWGAIGNNVIALQWKKDYTPCIHLGFESTCASNHCMQGIEISDVLSALSTLNKTS
ncbi:MAG: glycosyltransferase family 9 protein [Chlamydiota bacterium]